MNCHFAVACFADIDFGQVQVQATQMTTQGHPGAPSEWRTVLGRHFYAYGSAMLTSLLCPTSVAEFREEKSGAELHRQVLTIVDLCSFIAKITPNTTGATQKYFYQILSKRAERCLIGEELTAAWNDNTVRLRRQKDRAGDLQDDVRSPRELEL